MRFVDRAVAHRLELTDAYGGVSFVRAMATANPDSGATAEPIAGGWAIFAGTDSPLTQAFALGLGGPVEEEEIIRLEEFFRGRGAATNVELCPYADPTITEIFRKRGYTPVEFSNVLARKLGPQDAQLSGEGAVRVREPEPQEALLWAETVASGFTEDGIASDMLVELFTTSLRSAAGRFFLGEVDGEIAGGGVLIIHNGVASLGGASTLSEFRNRGVQTALLRARLALAARNGCDIAMVTTLPGTVSQRNAERHDLRVVYTRAKFCKE